jgi:hypothetical protein
MGGDFAPETELTTFSLSKRWRKVQDLISRVWRRWMSEYLPMLRSRSKWNEVVADMKKGDVVLVHQPDLARGLLPLGRIVDTFLGKDRHTRAVKVQCGQKTYLRPVHKLVAGHFAERHLCRKTLCRKTFFPKDILPNGRFAERTFCRTDILPNGRTV